MAGCITSDYQSDALRANRNNLCQIFSQRDRIRTCVTTFPKRVTEPTSLHTVIFSQSGWTRTSDPSPPMRALFQLSYTLIYQGDRIRTCVTMIPNHVTNHLAYTLLKSLLGQLAESAHAP